MAALPVYGLEDFLQLLEDGDFYPFYSVILYTPENGLDQRLHDYVEQHWRLLNRLTGDNSLLAALEDRGGDRSISAFRPEEVYDIARELGVSVAAVPALVFFTSPKDRSETLVLRLGDFLPADVSDAGLTDFFRSLAGLVDRCAGGADADRLDCLRKESGPKVPSGPTGRRRSAEHSSLPRHKRRQFLDHLA
jgi:hypothetical protein